MTQKPKVFIREATGLVREFGSWDAFGFQFGGITTAVGISVLFYSFNFLRGANILISLIILLPILVAYLIADSLLGIAMPRSGGDYVYAGRILHPALGLSASWMLVFLLVLNPGFLSDLITTGYIPGLLTAVGMSAEAAIFQNVAVRFVVDNILIAFCISLVIMPIRYYAKVQRAFIALAIVGAILIPGALWALGHDGFVAAVNARSPISYDAIIAKATSLGSETYFSWTDTILAIPGVGLFLITNWPCSVGGELRNVKRSLLVGNIGAGLISWVIFFVTAAGYYYILGPTFASSIGFLTVNSPADSPFGAANLLTSVIQYVYGLSWVTFSVFFCLFAAALICAAQSIFLSTRHILAWAFDNVIPSKFASVSDKYGTPVFTTLAVWAVSEIVLLVILFWSSALGIVLNAGIGVPMGYAPALFAAMLFASRRKDIFDSSPSIVRFKIGGVHASTICGLIGGVGFVVFVAFTAAFPQAGYPITPWNVGFLISIYLLGVVLYYAAKYYRARQGLDIALAFKQVPPE